MVPKDLLALCIAGTLLFVLLLGSAILMFVAARTAKDKHLIQVQRLLEANLEEGERMMNQIAKEVHDNVGQLSHLLFMTLRKGIKATDLNQREACFDRSFQLIDSIIITSDYIGHSLNSDYIKKRGLVNIIQEDLANIKRISKIDCRFDVVGDIKHFNPDSELLIYRIAQEAIHNSLKHSQASILSVILTFSGKGFFMQIIDNGIGFLEEELVQKGGIGFMNMKGRSAQLNGQLKIQASVGEGCQLKLSIEELS